MVSKPNYVGFFFAESPLLPLLLVLHRFCCCCVCVVAVFKFPFFSCVFFFFVCCAVLFFLWPFVCRSFTFTFTVPYPYHISRVWSGADWGRSTRRVWPGVRSRGFWDENPLATRFRQRKSLQIPTSKSNQHKNLIEIKANFFMRAAQGLPLLSN